MTDAVRVQLKRIGDVLFWLHTEFDSRRTAFYSVKCVVDHFGETLIVSKRVLEQNLSYMKMSLICIKKNL